MPKEEVVTPSLEYEESEVEINFNYKFAEENLTQLPHKNIFTGISTMTDTLKCDFCPFTYSDQNDLNIHVKETHEDNRRHVFFTINQLFAHKQSTQGTAIQLFDNEHSTIHLKTHIETERKISCPICGNMFHTDKTIKQHLRIHNGKQIPKCTICYKTFSRTTDRKDHMNRHNNIKPFKCLYCEKAFFTRMQLYRHKVTNRHSETAKQQQLKVLCYICNASFTSKHSLDEHMNQHVSKKPHKCLQCRKALFTLPQLYAHKSSHSLYDLICKICNKTFSSKYALQRHVKTTIKHEESKEFLSSKAAQLHNDLETKCP